MLSFQDVVTQLNGKREMTEKARPSEKPEIFIGLVGAVGADIDAVEKCISDNLKNVGYDARTVRMSELLHDLSESPWCDLPSTGPEDERIKEHMKAGNKLRRTLQRGDAVAGLSALQIRDFRAEMTQDPNCALAGTAYIFNSLKHPREVDTLRDIYGASFILVAVYRPTDKRVEALAQKIAQSRNSPNSGDFRAQAEGLRTDDEHQPGDRFGQNVRETFPKADVFVDGSQQETLEQSIQRTIEIIFGYPFHTPTRDEYGMFHAQAAAVRSADLSRQVGAAIASPGGDIVAVGTNDVPKAGGGQYWEGDSVDARDFRVEEDKNQTMKESMIKELLELLNNRGLFSEELADKSADELYRECSAVIKDAQISAISEFGRSVHAEMAAIADAAQRPVALNGTTLYTSTFPCHNCTKHIIAAGIMRVVYIEPYPKSRALDLHGDAISLDTTNTEDGKVVFHPFVGVSPRRYIDWFTASGRRKDRHGKPTTWNGSTARPTFANFTPWQAYIVEEQSIAESIQEQLHTSGLLQE